MSPLSGRVQSRIGGPRLIFKCNPWGLAWTKGHYMSAQGQQRCGVGVGCSEAKVTSWPFPGSCPQAPQETALETGSVSLGLLPQQCEVCDKTDPSLHFPRRGSGLEQTTSQACTQTPRRSLGKKENQVLRAAFSDVLSLTPDP